MCIAAVWLSSRRSLPVGAFKQRRFDQALIIIYHCDDVGLEIDCILPNKSCETKYPLVTHSLTIQVQSSHVGILPGK